jgi:hypothetical protein
MRSIFTVTDPASETSLLTIEELRAAAGVTGSSQDTALMALGQQLSEAIAVSCGVASDGEHPRTLLSEACSETFRIKRCVARLRLARRPVSAIASVTVDDEALDAAEYEIDKASGLLFRICGDWPCGTVEVSFTAGFATAPGALKLAASKLTTALYAESGRDPNLKRVDIPDVMEKEFWVAPTNDPLLTTEIQDLLAPYKQVW